MIDPTVPRVRDGSYWPARYSIDMSNPLGMTEAEVAPLFAADGGFSDLLDALDAANGMVSEPRRQKVN